MHIRTLVFITFLLLAFNASAVDEDPVARMSLTELFDAGGVEETEGVASGRMWAGSELLRRHPTDVFAEARKRLKTPNPNALTHAFSIYAIDLVCRERMQQLTREEVLSLDTRGRQQWLAHVWEYPAPAYKALMLEIARNPGAWQSERDLLPPQPVLRTPLIVAAKYFSSHCSAEAANVLQAALDFLPAEARSRTARIGAGFPFISLASDLSTDEKVEELLRRAIALGRCSAQEPLEGFRFSLLDLDVVPITNEKTAPADLARWVSELEKDELADEAARKLLLRGAAAITPVYQALKKNPEGKLGQRLRVIHDTVPVVTLRRQILSPCLYSIPVKELPGEDVREDLASRFGVDYVPPSRDQPEARILYGGENIPAVELVLRYCAARPAVRFDPPTHSITGNKEWSFMYAVHNATVASTGGVGVAWGVQSNQYHAFRSYVMTRFWNVNLSGEFVPDAYILRDGTEIPGRVFSEHRLARRSGIVVESAEKAVRENDGLARVRGTLRVWLPLRCAIEYAEIPAEKKNVGAGVITAFPRGYSIEAEWYQPRAGTAIQFEAVLGTLDENGALVDRVQPRRGSYFMNEGMAVSGSAGDAAKSKNVRVIYFTQAEERWIPMGFPERKIILK